LTPPYPPGNDVGGDGNDDGDGGDGGNGDDGDDGGDGGDGGDLKIDPHIPLVVNILVQCPVKEFLRFFFLLLVRNRKS